MSSSDRPSRSCRARSSRAASATSWEMICRSNPSNRACSEVIGRPKRRPSCCRRSLYVWRNWSTVISVRPIFATVERPKPLKMSPMPQIAKLTISRPITAPMTILPSQFLEAVRIPRSMGLTVCWEEVVAGTGSANSISIIGREAGSRNTGSPWRPDYRLVTARADQRTRVGHGRRARRPLDRGQLEDERLAVIGRGIGQDHRGCA